MPRFKDKVDALAPDEPLQLVVGDVAAIADAVGADKSTVHRAIAAKPGTRTSAGLIARIEAAVGVPIGRIRLIGRVGPGRPSTHPSAA